MQRSSSMETTASAGVSSGGPTRCRASRTGRVREGPHDTARLADRLLLRRQRPPPAGVAATALTGALDLIAQLGGSVEGYPEPAGAVAAGFLYHRALSTYEKLGFTRDRKLGKHRWVVTIDVAPS
jgi:hypothetical protein